MTKAEIKSAIQATKTRANLLNQQADSLRKKSPVKAAQIVKEARAETARLIDLRTQLARLAVNTVIEFEDTGQDLLTWLLSPSGEVIDCAPMQRNIWIGKQVTGSEGKTPGKEYLNIATPDGEVRLKHAVKSMTRSTIQSLEELEVKA